VKTGCNLAESSKESYGSNRAVWPIMMMMIDKFMILFMRSKRLCHMIFITLTDLSKHEKLREDLLPSAKENFLLAFVTVNVITQTH
jgi:hypothetical protein